MANPDREIRIAVMGATGSGKSMFINKASESNLPVSSGLESCTSEVRTSRPFIVSGRVITLIDTPGFDDTTRSDTDVLAMIAAYLSRTYKHGARLAGVIYMHRISDFKMGGTCSASSVEKARSKTVLIVTNMWSEVKPEIGEARESELAGKDKFFKPAIEKGARMLRHDGTLESAHITLRCLLDSHSAPLAIQQEIVDEQMSIETTAAGSELRRALNEQADRNKEEIRNLRAEMEAAMRAKHEEKRGKVQRELEKKQQESEFDAELKRLEARIAQMDDEHQKQLKALEGLQGDIARVQSETRKQEEAAAAKKVEENTQSRIMEQQRLADQREEEERRKLVPPSAEQSSKLAEQVVSETSYE
ncbi:P-loop containing nucleoside triphosphate hydrolase protein [Suillus subalutaceus]|uniref:P-loop containing nucleoside triphosphate hydrolase protein n=1 Tax=Suillus subalutaceus TaxID=48586 RepID=UPI001B883ED4|nr:P-loop containing nucleoside triphosphate hydrolase protein [Suillus subalutaceus]KAG1862138.1 P-loop containing nucleoside triphosphate hydrolase protein [Suillus subalutaceus]